MRPSSIDIAGLVVVGLLLFVQDAAADTWLDVNLGSTHIASDGYYTYSETSFYDPRAEYWRRDENGDKVGLIKVDHEWNEKNWGLGVDHDINHHVSVVAGFFKNSFGITTKYAGLDVHTSRAKPIQLGVALGPMRGYEDTLMPAPFMVLPNVKAELGDFRVSVGWIPGSVLERITGNEGIDVLTFSVGYRF